MPKYRVVMVDTDGSKEEMDEIFDNYDDAIEYANESYNDFITGAEVLELAGESFEDPDDVEFVVEEIWGDDMSFLDLIGGIAEAFSENNSKVERFPDVDWWCDHCNAYLNDQSGFDDHKYIWKCTDCGYKNSISSDNIF